MERNKENVRGSGIYCILCDSFCLEENQETKPKSRNQFGKVVKFILFFSIISIFITFVRCLQGI